MVSYVTTLNHPYTHGFPDREYIPLEGVQVALALARGCRYICSELARSLQKASRKAKEIAIDVRTDVEEFFDVSLFIDSGPPGTSGHSETERLLGDLFFHLEDLCEAYDPLMDYFEPHGHGLAALETRIIKDFEDVSTTNSVECWDSCAPMRPPLLEFGSSSPSLSPSPSEEFLLPWVSIKKESEKKIQHWESCSTRVNRGLISELRAIAFMFRDRDPGNTSLRGYEYAEAFRKGFVEGHERRKVSTRIRSAVGRVFATSKPFQY
ncbi:hypothetical protein P691DRAFT_809748 [Macrolepiota fuliginosa MF-IS2]|uniref:Uncharacterized protein n=1 Tax=Macrolepiota fuliginosa MF-IS2 TaxID=1400762 RepID=A0A9P6BXC4_9AGAR|nr:hypothetical protein P691DRAFT_809748 [Macrolepiota fuliginosa MF-IS2]